MLTMSVLGETRASRFVNDQIPAGVDECTHAPHTHEIQSISNWADWSKTGRE